MLLVKILDASPQAFRFLACLFGLLGVSSGNGKNRTLRPSKDHSIKGKRSRDWKTNCLVMGVERSF
jgi:hypothetical protein